MILFLDFDGTLHPYSCKMGVEFCHLPRFEKVMRDYPHVRIVISSWWRVDQDLETLRSYFSEDIRPRIIDVTPEVSEYVEGKDFLISKSRHAECEAWIKANDYGGSWVALDDAVKEFPDPCLQLVECKTWVGFDEGVEVVLRKYLDRHLQPSDVLLAGQR